MGGFLKFLGIGLLLAGLGKIKQDADEEKRRKNTVCHFDGEISEEEFYVIVKRGGKGIRRITSLYAEGTMVYGTVRSQSGISNWCFTVDFNDYGKLTGKYWISTENNDSNILRLSPTALHSKSVNIQVTWTMISIINSTAKRLKKSTNRTKLTVHIAENKI